MGLRNLSTGLTDITGTVVLNDTTDEITFTINDSFAIVEEGSTDVTLFVTIDYATTLDTETNVIYSFKSISYGASDGATTFTLDSGSAPALRGLDNSIVTSTDIYDYVVTFGGADAVVNANEEEGTEDLVVLRVDLGGGVPDEAANKDVESITFAYTGTTTADVPAASVRLYYDADGSGAFEIANDSLVATGTSWSGTDITLAIPDTIAYATADAELDNDIDAAEESFFLLLNIADLGGAGVGRTIGFEVVDESSTDVQFYDSIDDYIEGTTAGIGFTTFEYDQSGYVTTSAGLASSLITIDPKTVIDTTPPTIIASNPSDATAGVSRNLATIALTFDDLMFDDSGLGDPGSVTTLANYSMTGPTTVTLSGVTFNSGNRTATLTVDSGSLPLQYEGDYTVTVVNVENTDGYGMISDSILFTIEAESPPTVLGTIPADGSTDAAIGTSVGIIFSEAMDETTITNEANFSLFAEGAAEEVPGAMTYTASGNHCNLHSGRIAHIQHELHGDRHNGRDRCGGKSAGGGLHLQLHDRFGGGIALVYRHHCREQPDSAGIHRPDADLH